MPARQAQQLSQKVEALGALHGDYIRVSDIAEIVSSMVTTMHGEMELTALNIGSEVKELIDFINVAKVEIASIRPNSLSKKDIPTATDELDAIVQHTEAAAGQIMDCADELGDVAKGLEGEIGETLSGISMKIFEASSFQDITGQRVTKVVKVLKHIEEKLAALASAIGDTEVTEDEKPAVALDADGAPANDADLLNGPQLEGMGNSQDDIDALLASFD